MDANLNSRWKAAEPPFGFECLHPDDLVRVAELRRALRFVIDQLRASTSECPLRSLEAWHDHDGYVTSSHPTSWEAMDPVLESDAQLYAGRHGDTYVHRAFYAENHSFLLRFDVLDEDEDDQYPGI